MTLFILTETSAGYALLKAKDKKLLKRDDLDIPAEAATPEGVSNLYVSFYCSFCVDFALTLPKFEELKNDPLTPILD
jgi:hypothetical protein